MTMATRQKYIIPADVDTSVFTIDLGIWGEWVVDDAIEAELIEYDPMKRMEIWIKISTLIYNYSKIQTENNYAQEKEREI